MRRTGWPVVECAHVRVQSSDTVADLAVHFERFRICQNTDPGGLREMAFTLVAERAETVFYAVLSTYQERSKYPNC